MKLSVETPGFHQHESFHCVVRQEPHFDFLWHVHDCFELTYIQEGHGERFVGDHIEPYQKGDFVLLGPGLAHTWVSSRIHPHRKNKAVYCHFPKKILGDAFLQLPELKSIKKLLESSHCGWFFRGKEAAEASKLLLSIPHQSGFERLQNFLTILHFLSTLPKSQKIKISSAAMMLPQNPARTKIQNVLAYLHAHLTEKITVNQMMKIAKMNRRTFSRNFKRATSKTLMTYINELKVGRACSLLMETDLTVTEICYDSGFMTLPYFNRTFLKLKQMTPSSYRKKWAPLDKLF